MKKNNAIFILLTCLLTLPVVVYAQNLTSLNTSFGQIGGSINAFTNGIVRSLITLFATAAMAAFFFGIVQYIWGFREGKQEQISNGRKFMVWSLLALFVMFSVWGIIYFFQDVLGVGGNNRMTIPGIQVGGSGGGAGSPLGGSCSSITTMNTCASTPGCVWNLSNSTCQ